MAAPGTASFWHRDGALCAGWTAYISTLARWQVHSLRRAERFFPLPPCCAWWDGSLAVSPSVCVGEYVRGTGPRTVEASLRVPPVRFYLRCYLPPVDFIRPSGAHPCTSSLDADDIMASAYTTAFRDYFVVMACFVDSTPSAEKGPPLTRTTEHSRRITNDLARKAVAPSVIRGPYTE